MSYQWKAAFCEGNYSLLSGWAAARCSYTWAFRGALVQNPRRAVTVLLHRRHAALPTPHNPATATESWGGGHRLNSRAFSNTHQVCLCLAPGRGRHQRRSLKSISVFGPWEANGAWQVGNTASVKSLMCSFCTWCKKGSEHLTERRMYCVFSPMLGMNLSYKFMSNVSNLSKKHGC